MFAVLGRIIAALIGVALIGSGIMHARFFSTILGVTEGVIGVAILASLFI